MALLNIVLDDDQIMRKKSKPVDKITPRILQLLDDMKETLDDANGAGLAAVQVGVLRRVALVYDEDKYIELINPEIIETEGKQEDIEGCLSCPGKWGYTNRPMKVKIRAMNRNGEIETHEGKGLTARAFCHEIDHLDGILFYDNAVRMIDESELEEILKKDKEAE
ncbi:MAG: peptide deformylase [Clostridiales bacterium GWF2_38_85]|nr:MAG: peptide deformylase [Clostridiales bacterium GWF2_38_85]HBL84018.1 peptide deformylase [Clostridiales bacterium]